MNAYYLEDIKEARINVKALWKSEKLSINARLLLLQYDYRLSVSSLFFIEYYMYGLNKELNST